MGKLIEHAFSILFSIHFILFSKLFKMIYWISVRASKQYCSEMLHTKCLNNSNNAKKKNKNMFKFEKSNQIKWSIL